MKEGRIKHILNTLMEIVEGNRGLGSPLSEELLVLCPGQIHVNLMAGEVTTALPKGHTLRSLVNPLIEFIQTEIKQDTGSPGIEKAEATFTLGPAAPCTIRNQENYDFDVKRDEKGKAYKTFKTRELVTPGREYEFTVKGVVVWSGKPFEFGGHHTMQIPDQIPD